MNQIKILGIKSQVIEITFLEDLRLPQRRDDPHYVEIAIQISSGAWTSSRFSLYIETESLILFCRDLKKLLKLSCDGANLQSENDMLFIRVALSSNKNEIWIYGHAKELDHRNELRFSFDSTLALMTSIEDQIDAIALDE